MAHGVDSFPGYATIHQSTCNSVFHSGNENGGDKIDHEHFSSDELPRMFK